MHDEKLILIAMLLPDPVAENVRHEQIEIASRWGPKHALRTPPHITVIPPLSVSHKEDVVIRQLIVEECKRQHSIELEVDRYGAFKPGVVFLNIVSSRVLDMFYKSLRRTLESRFPPLFGRYPDRPYRPHITLAHRDVKENVFWEIWGEYRTKEVRTSMLVNGLWILVHEKSGWRPDAFFEFLG